MPPKRAGQAALKPRTSRSRVAKSSPKTTPRSTPRKTKSKSSIKSTPTSSKAAATPPKPYRLRQKKRVSAAGTSISTIRDSPEPSHTPSPPTRTRTPSDPEESTGFYGLGFVRSVTQQARDFFSGWGYGFGKATAAPKKKTRGKKGGPKKK
ncbi:hypothetical protein TWF281_009004 [Arthrobotrys megalospora]